jgi:glycosyltransferase involved in cell wall biosynthesis
MGAPLSNSVSVRVKRQTEMSAEYYPENKSLRILLVSTCDIGGGAERSAWNLFKVYSARGYKTWMAVGRKYTQDPNVLPIPNESSRSRWAKVCLGVRDGLRFIAGNLRGMDRLDYALRRVGEPRRFAELKRGYEDFHFPGTGRLLQLSEPPDIVHCFNLHGGYFDLRALTWLSNQQRVILDLRDAWLLSGHCAHSLGCEKWRAGCGDCPDLSIPPAIERDATAYNWRRKQAIYTQSRLYVSTPCHWLMRQVEQSILAPAVVEARVIPSGVDLTIFHPADKRAARAALGLPHDAKLLVFAAANGVRRNIWKDYETIRAAISLVAEHAHGQRIVFLALGEDAAPERIGEAEVRFIPYQNKPETVACYYQAADLYVHAAKADTFPRVVLEALACGTPVVATAVGGIPEAIKGLDMGDCGLPATDFGRYGAEEATGVVVPLGEAVAMALGITRLLNDDAVRHRMGENAAKDARERFDLQRQADRYLQWYRKLLSPAARYTHGAVGLSGTP